MANYLKDQNIAESGKRQAQPNSVASLTTAVDPRVAEVTADLEASLSPPPTPAPIRRPARKRYEEDLEKLSVIVKAKEAELRCLQQQHSGEDDPALGGGVWQQRDESIARRRIIDERLQAANKDITLKRDALARIHSTVNYKSEDRINGAIARLEYQLRVNNFKVNEEKRIVKEIDTLNRSKRNLKEYLTKKAELDIIHKELQVMRNERDALFRKVNELKQKGDTLKRESKERKARIETLKKDLDELYAEKHQHQTAFRQSFSKYQQSRAEFKRQAQKNNDVNEELPAETVVQAVPFSKEIHLCLTLLKYLGRFECSQVTSALTPSLAVQDFITKGLLSEGHTPVSPTEEGLLLRRKDECCEEDWVCAWGSGRGTRAKRNHTKKIRQQQKKKPITHTPEVFEQFCRLQLVPPALMNEVPAAIEQLKAKKKFYEHLSQAGDTQHVPDLPLYSLSSAKSHEVQELDQILEVHQKESSSPEKPAKGCEHAANENMPAETESLPTETESSPTETESLPAETESLPTETESLPAETESLPAVSKNLSATNENLPATSESLPVASAVTSASLKKVAVNAAPNSLDLGPSTYVSHLNGYVNGLDDTDMGYSSGNGYLGFESKRNNRVQTIES